MGDFLFPQKYHLESVESVKHIVYVPWEEKLDVLFWRGSTTGGMFKKNYPWRKYHRTNLIKWERDFRTRNPLQVFDSGENFSKYYENYPKINNPQFKTMIDVGFNRMVQNDVETHREIEREFGLKKPLDYKNTLKFKYLLVIDGNTWPARFQSYLSSGSVLLYNGIFEDWFNWKIKPWIHYVPVNLDFSDLEEKLIWLKNNEEKAKEIVENARKIMVKLDDHKQMQCYAGLFFMEYQRLYRDDSS
ncbi:F-actin-capping protein subunit alpha [Clydaea vesicula]|uniref:F-actin-capping protein subunit alpha n=1 Tax=Clydaea vesicula TaxID=447962 RepID=A0AAD5TTF5_9FUNG|nr:F-actin-capping protein subunit alpha [Clydaea vesicula]